MDENTQTKPNQPEEEPKKQEEENKPALIIGPAQLLFREMAMPDGSRVKELLVSLPHEHERLYRLVADLDRIALPDEESKALLQQLEEAMHRQMARAQLLHGGMPPTPGMGGPPPGTAPRGMVMPGGPRRG